VAFTIHRYEYEEKGGTAVSSARLGVPEHAVVKTLVFEERSSKAPLIVLMHGDKKVRDLLPLSTPTVYGDVCSR
jgi:prolyl-tRNA editing enzyme YbaK/EbsC (Cys-tRNA(Pro) deacylase)